MTSLEIQEKYKISSLAAAVLAQAALNEKQIEQILYPEDQLKECCCSAIDQAVERIYLAQKRKERVFIGGDYDADGIMATTILKETLDALGIENGFYIPNRFKDGYGLNGEVVKMVKERGYDLIITVDNGVAAEEAIETAHQLGLEILVTDHHTIQKTLNWDWLVHPDVLPEGFGSLCGAGVALQLSRKILGENRKHVILAMIATLADMMPVFDENRTIIRLGLKYLNETPLAQIEALKERSVKRWDEKEIAFQIVPKINAVGRLADQVNPNNVVRYFLLNNPSAVEGAAKQIKEINEKRKTLSFKMAEQALTLINDDPFVMVADEDFHEGLVGLAANRLMKSLQRPVAVFAKKGDSYKGSVRSYGNLDLIDFFEDLKPLLKQFGGHAAAAGIEVEAKNFELLKARVQEKMSRMEPLHEEGGRAISILSRECTLSAIRELEKLAPFGQGFEQPRFEVRDFDVLKTQVLKERYPKWSCRNESFDFEAISFTLNKSAADLAVESFTGVLQINEFRGQKSLSILVEELKTR